MTASQTFKIQITSQNISQLYTSELCYTPSALSIKIQAPNLEPCLAHLRHCMRAKSTIPCPCERTVAERLEHQRSTLGLLVTTTKSLASFHPAKYGHTQARNACTASTLVVPSSYTPCTPISTQPSS